MTVWKSVGRCLTIRLLIYMCLIFCLIAASTEAFLRFALPRATVQTEFNLLRSTNYTPAIDQLARIQNYVDQNGSPECLLFGSSLVQTGINPVLLSKNFQETSREDIDCYNVGMDGSTLSSTARMALLLTQNYRSELIILGIQIGQFLSVNQELPVYFAEDHFSQDGWLQYKLGQPNFEGWLRDNSVFYGLISSGVPRMFPVIGFSGIQNTLIRPEIPRTIDIAGYGPLLVYRDASPVFQIHNTSYTNRVGEDLNVPDITALQELIQHAKNGEFQLIVVEMPINDPSEFSNEVVDRVATLVRENEIPFLSTRDLVSLPATAYTDQLHMHISGSFMFSQWLGTQIGRAIATGALENVSDPVWTPTLESWDDSVFKDMLGLSETWYSEYLTYSASFDLVPENAIVFNPSDDVWDRELLQSLVGFTVDWQADLTDQDRLNVFQLMATLGVMRYEDELALASAATSSIERWRATLDPNLLLDMDSDYVICRVELVDISIEHCPTSIQNNPQYVPIAQWDFDPLYEQYHLYHVVTTP